MIAITDYDMGNLRSVQKAFERVGAHAEITRDPAVIESADGLVLPGVGAFGVCMDHLREYRLVEPIKSFIATGRPFFGICLGLQLLFEESEEFGSSKGLGVIRGKVVRFPETSGLKVPHMGWNNASLAGKSPLLEGIDDGTYFYFVHSYYVVPEEDVAVTKTGYGLEFVSSIEKGNIFATQFHPEKSQSAGLRILKNFAKKVGEI
jgi:glutamine amidotransferase